MYAPAPRGRARRGVRSSAHRPGRARGGGGGLGRYSARRILVRHAEGGAAPARRDDVRVVHLEAGAHQALGVVDGRAVHVAEALLVDENPDSLVLEDLVAVTRLVERELVLEARAAAALDGHAQAGLGLLLSGQELRDLLGGDFGEGDHL